MLVDEFPTYKKLNVTAVGFELVRMRLRRQALRCTSRYRNFTQKEAKTAQIKITTITVASV